MRYMFIEKHMGHTHSWLDGEEGEVVVASEKTD